MLVGQNIAILFESTSQVSFGIWLTNAMVQVDLHFAEAGFLHLGHPIQDPAIVLFDWIEVCVAKRSAVMISHCLANCLRLLVPTIEASHLSIPVELNSQPARLIWDFVVARFEMVCDDQDHVTLLVTGTQPS